MNTRRIVIITALIVTLAVLVVAAFGKRGMFALASLGDRKEKLTSEIQRLKTENTGLRQELRKLERPDYQEQTIRDQLGMAREGEVIYIFTTE